MRWREAVRPVLMERVAVLAPADALRGVLVQVADAGSVELDEPPAAADPAAAVPAPAAELLRAAAGATRAPGPCSPGAGPTWPAAPSWAGWTCSRARRSWMRGWPRRCAAAGSRRCSAGCPPPAVRNSPRAWPGTAVPWCRWPARAGSQPPTLLRDAPMPRQFGPLVTTYATVPYADVDPSLARRARVRRDVRHDVRRRRARRAAARARRCCCVPAAAARRPVAPGLAVPGRRRAEQHALRRCSTASSSARPASCRSSGWRRWTTRCTLLARRRRRRRGAAGRRVRAGHGEPVPRGRLAAGAVRPVRAGRRQRCSSAWACSPAACCCTWAGWPSRRRRCSAAAPCCVYSGCYVAAGGGRGRRRPGRRRAASTW